MVSPYVKTRGINRLPLVDSTTKETPAAHLLLQTIDIQTCKAQRPTTWEHVTGPLNRVGLAGWQVGFGGASVLAVNPCRREISHDIWAKEVEEREI